MPFVLIISGIVLLIAGVRNTQGTLYSLLRSDFTGPNNFVYWVLSILIIGAIGYIPRAKPISDGFLILVIVVLFLKRGDNTSGGGFFEMFQRQIGSTQSASSLPASQTPIFGGIGVTPPAVIPYDPSIPVIR